ncbi:general substrate transporter [Basidiobolus meristosporus CBS 931.73]|uniref:General substrate transporter n=1 Tax=Basidiobolus meristosporus CBS 931.73 TaxID=1314790 RepID=A0A1Y1YSS0_9FUNG|nr:general substrate transporter [Basidiobolus meristosporus CBS 931.73]|eukprot:ORY00625.1 general substrate transporter [Basidiobolus meristosporus CBS 931.73]
MFSKKIQGNPDVILRDSKDVAFTPYIWLCGTTAALASFTAGYNSAAPNTPESIIRNCETEGDEGGFPRCISMSSGTWGLAVGILAIGGLIGGLGAGPAAAKLGRRLTLLLNNIFFIAGAVLVATATTTVQFIVGRVVTGVGCGAGSVVAPMYVAEVSTDGARGVLGIMYQLFMVLGILVADCIGLGLSNIPGWRFLFGIAIIPPFLQVVLLPFCTETPSYLLTRNKVDEARMALQRLRKGCVIDAEFEQLCSAAHNEGSNAGENLSIWQVVRDSHLRGLLVIAIITHAFQQLSGINSVIYYSTSIFNGIFGVDNSQFVTVGVAGLNLIMTFVSVALIDRAGRKPLLYSSGIGMCICSVLIVVASRFEVNVLMVIAVMLFVASFAVGLGPIPWMLVPELVPTYAVTATSSTATAVNWLCNFVIGQVFPPMKDGLQDFAFLPFAVVCLLGSGYTYFFVPETKGRRLYEGQEA